MDSAFKRAWIRIKETSPLVIVLITVALFVLMLYMTGFFQSSKIGDWQV